MKYLQNYIMKKHITKLYNTTANPNLTSAGELKANKTYLFGYDGTY